MDPQDNSENPEEDIEFLEDDIVEVVDLDEGGDFVEGKGTKIHVVSLLQKARLLSACCKVKSTITDND